MPAPLPPPPPLPPALTVTAAAAALPLEPDRFIAAWSEDAAPPPPPAPPREGLPLVGIGGGKGPPAAAAVAACEVRSAFSCSARRNSMSAVLDRNSLSGCSRRAKSRTRSCCFCCFGVGARRCWRCRRRRCVGVGVAASVVVRAVVVRSLARAPRPSRPERRGRRDGARRVPERGGLGCGRGWEQGGGRRRRRKKQMPPQNQIKRRPCCDSPACCAPRRWPRACSA